MKVNELIQILKFLESQNGNLNVEIDSYDYVLSVKQIKNAIEDNGKIKIIVTK